ncbi:uncharacterized protein SPPG_08785 [Spizellomyces punctatus DAOM BR117]|uniref:Uncharacterized protein n=1 Tax=Spizellomyces punctatus (strain DAOM BR117) TaxID=645134 RepID=A0A0L0H4E2_SPIPD|nr:uncharacterized protein SPPG_08785 [Spizellomyces punctatus DAOM BR117]KNC95791.1 hypothetical protein SPPG_08785 [Spizellomyces punctatus DAOM BR117]|eukprot:XP_016603831.1 hypothetical protein SPPG_08785 [Spizellomyces punctatus DAOM BR117]
MGLDAETFTYVLGIVVVSMGTLSTFESIVMAFQFLTRSSAVSIKLVMVMTISAFLCSVINLSDYFIATGDCKHHYAAATFYQCSFYLMDCLLIANANTILKEANHKYRKIILGANGVLLALGIAAGITDIYQFTFLHPVPGVTCIPIQPKIAWPLYGAAELAITLNLAYFFVQELRYSIHIMRKNKHAVTDILAELCNDHIVLSLLSAIIVFICQTLIEQNSLGTNTFFLIFIEHPIAVRLITYSVNPDFAELHTISKSEENLAKSGKPASIGSVTTRPTLAIARSREIRSRERIGPEIKVTAEREDTV